MTQATTRSNLAQEVLDHLARYRLAVKEVLAELPSAKSAGDLRQVLRELAENRLIGRATLYGTRPYFYLTSASKLRGKQIRSHHTGPLSELAKIRSFAMLAFCCQTQTDRQKLTTPELARVVPELSGYGNRDNYYTEQAASAIRIGHALIDSGTHGRWDRVLQKLLEDVRYHAHFDSVRILRERQQFEWAVLTIMPQKAARLREAMARMSELRGVQVRVCAIPELIHLIAPPAH